MNKMSFQVGLLPSAMLVSSLVCLQGDPLTLAQAHLNLRDRYLPYKRLIAEVILDKIQHVRTVINKVDVVGTTSEYRTFQYELLMGDPDMNVELKEQGCMFRFDYSKVYWNSRLETEHRRLVEKFREGEAVCDVMAGVGPFAIPAGKRKVFVWANDLNPDSYASLKEGIQRNKVHIRNGDDRFPRDFLRLTLSGL
jgi:tRNA (guanine37-N1)-methyltransferase